MSAEKMLAAPPEYKRVDGDEDPCCQRRRREFGRTRTMFALVIVGALVIMAVMFVGGYYAGRHHGNKDEHNSPYNAPPRLRFSKKSGGYVDVPALQGTQPVQDFMQCRTVEVNGSLTCVPSNPLLTPKGTLQFTLYQYGRDLHMIVTGTGSNYGEMAQRTKRDASDMEPSQISLHAENLNGELLKPSLDNYHSGIPSHSAVMNGAESTSRLFHHAFGSDAVLMHLNRSEWAKQLTIYFDSHGPLISQHYPYSAVLHGLNTTLIDMGVPPTKDQPIYVSLLPEEAEQDRQNRISNQWLQQTQNPDTFQNKLTTGENRVSDPETYAGPSNEEFSFVERRSTATQPSRSRRGALFKLFSKDGRKTPMSTIRITHDDRHGGSNGTIQFDITNHTRQCRAQFSMLYHSYLSDGEKYENTSHHQTYTYRHMNATHDSLSIWQAVTPPTSPESSRATPLVGEIPSKLDCVSDELGQLHQRMQELKNKPNKAARQRRHLLWNCGVGSTVEKGGECGYHGYKCGSDIAESDFTFGLSLIKGAWDCYGAVHSCYDFLDQCL